MICVLLVSCALLLALRMPLAVALGLSSAIGLACYPMTSPVIVAQRVFVALDSFPLMAVPLYMLAGFLMSTGGMSRRIVDFSAAGVGGVSGGLAHVNILASMIFGGISGSAVADTAGVGNIMIPEMKDRGYRADYSAAVTAVSSTLGIVFPPSIPMVVIGAMLGVSVGKLFLGGILPGLCIVAALLAVTANHARKHKDPANRQFKLGYLLQAFRQAFWALVLPLLIVLGIVTGLFSPTEAGAVAVIYALAVSSILYRELDTRGLRSALTDTVLNTGKVFFLIATAGLFSWLLTINGFPDLVGGWLSAAAHSTSSILLLVAGILLVTTMFIESIAALILLLPILYPATQSAGVDTTHFGVVVVVAIGIGLVTPPVGLCLFVSSDIAGCEVLHACRESLPFILAMIGVELLIIFVPGLSTLLPKMLMG